MSIILGWVSSTGNLKNKGLHFVVILCTYLSYLSYIFLYVFCLVNNVWIDQQNTNFLYRSSVSTWINSSSKQAPIYGTVKMYERPYCASSKATERPLSATIGTTYDCAERHAKLGGYCAATLPRGTEPLPLMISKDPLRQSRGKFWWQMTMRNFRLDRAWLSLSTWFGSLSKPSNLFAYICRNILCGSGVSYFRYVTVKMC